MYAETGLLLPYFQTLPLEAQQLNEFSLSEKPNASLCDIPSSLVQTSTISDYNLGCDGDLFMAPASVFEESFMSLDSMEAAISMMSCGEDVISTQSLTVSDIESSIQSGHLLSEVFYECRKDLLAKEGNQTPLSEVLSITIPSLKTDENMIAVPSLPAESQFQKSVSSSCLSSMECVPEAHLRPNFLDFQVMDFGGVYGMRRAFSEGDIKTLGNGNINVVRANLSPREPSVIMSSCTLEDRREKLSRYRNKRSKRNFGRKIKYACRKALADSQPRIRGRFAKTEETERSKKRCPLLL